jgi:hypothetical protein
LEVEENNEEYEKDNIYSKIIFQNLSDHEAAKKIV